MITLLAVSYGLVQHVSLVVFAMFLPTAALWARAWSARRVMALLALMDLLLLPLLLFASIWRAMLDGPPHFGPLAEAHAETYARVLIGVYAVSVGLTVSLLRQRGVPEWLTPATGIWSRRLVSLLTVSGFLFVLCGDLVRLVGTVEVEFQLIALILGLALLIYVMPAWDVLVRGWYPECSPADRELDKARHLRSCRE